MSKQVGAGAVARIGMMLLHLSAPLLPGLDEAFARAGSVPDPPPVVDKQSGGSCLEGSRL